MVLYCLLKYFIPVILQCFNYIAMLHPKSNADRPQCPVGWEFLRHMHTQRERERGRETALKSKGQRNLTEEEKPRIRAVRVQKFASCPTPSIIRQEKSAQKKISDFFEVTVSLSLTCWHVGQFRERERDREWQRKIETMKNRQREKQRAKTSATWFAFTGLLNSPSPGTPNLFLATKDFMNMTITCSAFKNPIYIQAF